MKLVIIIFSLFIISCAPKFSSEKSTIIHLDSSFKGAVDDGRTLLVFPVIKDTAFISFPIFEDMIEPLNLRRDRLVVTSYIQYRNGIVGEQHDELKFLESLILHETSLEIPHHIELFEREGFRFLQIFRVRNAYTVKNDVGEVRKHLTLEGEVWDTRKKGVVWRSESVVESGDIRCDDQIILQKGLELLYATLPKFYFNSSERNW